MENNFRVIESNQKEFSLLRYISYDIIHAVDWLPTLLHAAEAPAEVMANFEGLDGIDLYDTIFGDRGGLRQEFVYNLEKNKDDNGIYGAIR